MSQQISIQDEGRISDAVIIPEAPAIEGLRFRRHRGDEDFARMVAVVNGSAKADAIERVDTAEVVRNNYQHLTNCDLAKDFVIFEVEGQPNDGVIGYSRLFWHQEDATKDRLYTSFAFLLPEWRRKGIGSAVLKHNQRRMREIAAGHPDDGKKYFASFGTKTEINTNYLLLNDGYEVASIGAVMVRPDLENIGTTELPEGVEVRPATEDQFEQIWAAELEAFRDHYGFAESNQTPIAQWLEDPNYDPTLWRVAWQGDEVVGMVRSFINKTENDEFKRQRGWTEYISVRRPWRKMGVARALLNRSLHAIKERGMTEGALGVHVDNPNGAFHLYESCGFEVVRTDYEYRKLMD